jgi:hypothetical protein
LSTALSKTFFPDMRVVTQRRYALLQAMDPAESQALFG